MLLPLFIQIDASQGIGPPGSEAGIFGRAYAAAPPVTALSLAPDPAGALLPPPIAGLAAPFAWPSFATLTAPIADIGVPTGAMAAFARDLQFWLAAVAAGLATWLIRLRNARWTRIAAKPAETAASLREAAPETDSPPPPEAIIPVADPQGQAQGADLAARARFVAMSFAFPEVSIARPGLADWPLHVSCEPARFTLTMRHAALGYRLSFCNRGAEPLGPLIVRAELVATESRMAQDHQAEFAADGLPLCHYLDSLPAGESMELAGELRLPLAGVAAIRLGTAELLVPLLRLCAESAGAAQPALSVSACFAVGMPPLSPGGGIQPFRLDTGPGIWRKLTARRLLLGDMRQFCQLPLDGGEGRG